MVMGTTVAIVPLGSATGATTPAAMRVGRPPRLPAGAVPGSSLPSSAPLDVDVVLTPRDPAALTAFARAVTTVGSPVQGRFLRPGEFATRFGAAPSAIATVTAALRAAGLRPERVSSNGLSIPVRATEGAISKAFATGFRQYRLRDDRTVFANTAAPLVPASAAPDVQAVVGLDNLAVPVPALSPAPAGPAPAGPATTQAAADRAKPQGGDSGPQACPTADSKAASDDAETTDQVAAAYGFPDVYGEGDLGSGVTVALYELQGYGSKDIAAYQSCYGTDSSVTAVDVDGGSGRDSGVGEADVDIEQVVGLAPGANVLVYEGPNTDTGAYDTYNAIVSADDAHVVSTSWGLCETEEGSEAADAEDVLFEEAAAQGQGIFAAAGDQGSEDCVSSGYSDGFLAVDDPSSQPFVTGVGGTSWVAAGTPPDETAWNDGPTCCWGAGGGGISTFWTMPSYQSDSAVAGVLSPYSSSAPCRATAPADCRESPDVSALAGPYPYLQYVSGHWGAWGGTSLAAPLWAALTALADDSSACTGRNVGFANPALYQAAASEPSAFNDVTTGNNDLTGDNGGLYPAGTGYDMATGLGTPNAGPLVDALCAASAPSPVTVDNPGSQSSLVGSSTSLQITANDSTSGQTLTYRATGLPAGLSIGSSNGLISGQPTTAGTSVVTVTAKDGNRASGWTSFEWSVTDAITSPSEGTATTGQGFSFTFTATGDPTSMTVKGARPKGIKRDQSDGSASLSGTPSSKDSPGDYPLTVTATYGKGKSATTATQSFSLVLQAA
jgi:subtilase family serine protease